MLGTIHAALMCLAFSILFAAFLTARFLRRKGFWLKTHRALALSGVLCAILGGAAMAAQVAHYQGEHLASPHGWVGAVVLLLLAGAAIVGLVQLRLRGAAPGLRRIHRPLGRVTIALMAANVVLGLKLIGVV